MPFTFYSHVFTGIASIMLGLFVYFQGKTKHANVALMLNTIAVSIWCLAQAAGSIPQDKSVVLVWTRLNLAGAIFIPPTYLYFIFAFLDILKPKIKLVAAFFIAAALFLLTDFTPLFVKDIIPKYSYNFYPSAGPVYYLFPFYVLLVIIIGFYYLIRSLKGSYGERRNQILYVFIASVLGFGGGLTAFFPAFNIQFPSLAYYFLPLYVAITVYAILKHKMLDIRIIIRSGITYSVITLFFTGTYSLALIVFSESFKKFTGWNSFYFTAACVFGFVVVFEPLRKTVQEQVDRVFLGQKYEHSRIIRDLSAKLESLGTMAAGLAHEIKNPLASIKGLTQILPENLSDPEFLNKYMDIVLRQLDRIDSLIETLLQIGKPKDIAMGKVNIKDVFSLIIRLVENECKKLGIEIKINVSDLVVYGNSEQLTQAFMNIILNAIESMPQGGDLSIKSQENGNEAMIEITDTGCGIPQDNLKRLFDPFFTTKEKGTGLGLAVFYRIIKEHKGEVSVESSAGRGTTFKIWLYTKQKE